eukprot:2214-Heterococcus_DN1.PRE.2
MQLAVAQGADKLLNGWKLREVRQIDCYAAILKLALCVPLVSDVLLLYGLAAHHRATHAINVLSQCSKQLMTECTAHVLNL